MDAWWLTQWMDWFSRRLQVLRLSLWFPPCWQVGGHTLSILAGHCRSTGPPALGGAPAGDGHHPGPAAPLHDDVALVGGSPALPAPGKP